MNKSTNYYQLVGHIDGIEEVIFGSFNKADCTYELEAERDSLKADGYKKIKIISSDTTDSPDPEVYPDGVTGDEYLYPDGLGFSPDDEDISYWNDAQSLLPECKIIDVWWSDSRGCYVALAKGRYDYAEAFEMLLNSTRFVTNTTNNVNVMPVDINAVIDQFITMESTKNGYGESLVLTTWRSDQSGNQNPKTDEVIETYQNGTTVTFN